MSFDDTTLLAWAHAAGTAALPAFGALLLLLLAVAALLERSWRHPRIRRLRGTLPPAWLLGAALAAGFIGVLAAAALFAEIAEAVLAAHRVLPLDQAFTAGVRSGTPGWAVQGFAIVTHLGDTRTLVLLALAVALGLLRAGRQRLAGAWLAAMAGNGLLNWGLKQLFARARPDLTTAAAPAEGFSFPSGHSSGSLVAYGMLAYLALRLAPPRWHRAAVLGAAALALTVAASRIFLRVHYASDVLAGLASGAAWLGVCIAAIELARRRTPG